MKTKYRVLILASKYGNRDSVYPKQVFWEDGDYDTEVEAEIAIERLSNNNKRQEYSILKVYSN